MDKKEKEFVYSMKPIQRAVPEAPPYVACGEYLLSKKTTKELPRNINFEDLSKRSVATKYHFVRKKYNKVEVELQAMKRKEQEHRICMEQQWKQLEDDEEELRNSFIKYNTYLEENHQKRERAAKKTEEMTVLTKEKNEEHDKMKTNYENMVQLKSLLNEDIKKNIIFEKYLLEVVKNNKSTFSTTDQIIARFDALVKAREDLIALHLKYFKHLEDLRTRADKMVMDKYVELNGLSNTLTDLRKRYDIAKENNEKMEKFHNKAVLTAMDRVLAIQYVKDSCSQIYEQICKRNNKQPVYQNNYGKQLNIIKNEMKKLSWVNRMVEELKKEDSEPPVDSDSIGDIVIANVIRRIKSSK